MAEILTNVTTFIDSAFDWLTPVVDIVLAQPILFIFVVAVPLVGLGVGLFNRLIKAN